MLNTMSLVKYLMVQLYTVVNDRKTTHLFNRSIVYVVFNLIYNQFLLKCITKALIQIVTGTSSLVPHYSFVSVRTTNAISSATKTLQDLSS